jgi:hypothetical protein
MPELDSTVAIDTPGGKRNLKMNIKAQQMTFRQDITKYKGSEVFSPLTGCLLQQHIPFRLFQLDQSGNGMTYFPPNSVVAN